MSFSTRTLPGLAAALLVAGLAWGQPIPTTRPTTPPDLRINAEEWIEDPTIVEVRPGGGVTIQDAVRRAKPGTVINVRAGDYPGHLNLSNVHGTPARPILLISADCHAGPLPNTIIFFLSVTLLSLLAPSSKVE